jgi:hypothetical protein
VIAPLGPTWRASAVRRMHDAAARNTAAIIGDDDRLEPSQRKSPEFFAIRTKAHPLSNAYAMRRRCVAASRRATRPTDRTQVETIATARRRRIAGVGSIAARRAHRWTRAAPDRSSRGRVYSQRAAMPLRIRTSRSASRRPAPARSRPRRLRPCIVAPQTKRGASPGHRDRGPVLRSP